VPSPLGSVVNGLSFRKSNDCVQEKKLFDKVKLSKDCRFSNLLKLANENKGEALAEFIYINVLDGLSYITKDNTVLYYILFYEDRKSVV
jgi:hypothetical protein